MRLGRAAGITDTGRRRLRNEDAFICEPPLFAVADGMGGARAGEVAAGLAATAFEEAGADVSSDSGLEALIEEANRRIWERSVTDPATAGMGRGHDGRARRHRHGHGDDRARRRLARVQDPRRGDRAAHDRPLARGRARRERRPHAGGSRAPSPALGDHARSRHRAGGLGRHAHDRGEPGRSLPHLLRRPLEHARRRRDRGARVVGRAPSPRRRRKHSCSAANARGGEDNITVVLFELVAGDALEPAAPEAEPTQEIARRTRAPRTRLTRRRRRTQPRRTERPRAATERARAEGSPRSCSSSPSSGSRSLFCTWESCADRTGPRARRRRRRFRDRRSRARERHGRPLRGGHAGGDHLRPPVLRRLRRAHTWSCAGPRRTRTAAFFRSPQR